MEHSDLDRLVTKTELNPTVKRALRGVRKAVVSGRCGDPDIGEGQWSIAIESDGGTPIKMTFSFKRIS